MLALLANHLLSHFLFIPCTLPYFNSDGIYDLERKRVSDNFILDIKKA